MNDKTVAKRKPAQLTAEYIQLRDQKEAFEKLCSAKCRELYTDRMEIIEGELITLMNSMGVDSLKSKAGTAYKQTSVSVTTADAREFRRHVIGTEAWDLADWKPNKTSINEMVERGEGLPPGINRSTFATVRVRRNT